MRPTKAQKRRLRGLAGEVAFERMVFECPRCRASQAPMDAELGLAKGEQITRGLARRIVWMSAQGSFDLAAKGIKEVLGLEVGAAECQRMALAEGARIDALMRGREEEYLRPVCPDHPAPQAQIKAGRLVMMADGGTVLTVKGEEHKSVLCGRAFDLEDRDRKGEEAGPGRPFIGRDLHAASAVDMEDFGQRLKALGRRAGMRMAAQTAFVADGAAPLWKWAEENLPPGAVMIQDFWHVAEHLAALCREVYGEEAGAGPRLERWKEALLGGRVDEVISELDAEHAKRRGAKRQMLEREIGYLRRGRHRMDYARYREEGWPIGSGAIEADVKHLLKQRFDLAGARWRRANIFALLAIRVAIANDDFADFWSRN